MSGEVGGHIGQGAQLRCAALPGTAAETARKLTAEWPLSTCCKPPGQVNKTSKSTAGKGGMPAGR